MKLQPYISYLVMARATIFGICLGFVLTLAGHTHAQGIDSPEAKAALGRIDTDLKLILQEPLRANSYSQRYSSLTVLARALIEPNNPQIVSQLLGELTLDRATSQRLLVAVLEQLNNHPHALVRIEQNLEQVQKSIDESKTPMPNFGMRLLNSGLFVTGLVSFVYSMSSAFPSPEGTPPSFFELAGVTNNFIFLHLATALVGEWRAARLSIPAYLRQLRAKTKAQKNLKSVQELFQEVRKNPSLTHRNLAKLNSRYERAERNRSAHLAELMAGMWQETEDIQYKMIDDLRRRGFFNRNREFWNAIESLSQDLTMHEKLAIQQWLKGENIAYAETAVDQKLLYFERKVIEILKEHGFYENSNFANQLSMQLALLEKKIVEHQVESVGFIKLVEVNNTLLAASITIMGILASIGTAPLMLDSAFSFDMVNLVRDHWVGLMKVAGVLTIPSIAGFWWGLSKWMKRVEIQTRSSLSIIRHLRNTVDSEIQNSKRSALPTTIVDQGLAAKLADQLFESESGEFTVGRISTTKINLNSSVKKFCGSAFGR